MGMRAAVTETVPTYLELVAEAVLHQPELLAVARANVARWLGQGAQARERLLAWDALLQAAGQSDSGMDALQQILRGQSPESERLREFAPFAGVLPRQLRRQARDLCTYRH